MKLPKLLFLQGLWDVVAAGTASCAQSPTLKHSRLSIWLSALPCAEACSFTAVTSYGLPCAPLSGEAALSQVYCIVH